MVGGGDERDEERIGRKSRWEAVVDLPDLKFCAAHFVAFRGFREPLHGHNYTAAVRVGGARLGADGYVVDFGDLKAAARRACKSLDHCTLLPGHSEVLQLQGVKETSGQVTVVCEDGCQFSLPAQDCVVLPIVHTTAEELAEHIWARMLLDGDLGDLLVQRGIAWLEVTVSERPGQGASFRSHVSVDVLRQLRLRVKDGRRPPPSLSRAPPAPCFAASSSVPAPPMLRPAASAAGAEKRPAATFCGSYGSPAGCGGACAGGVDAVCATVAPPAGPSKNAALGTSLEHFVGDESDPLVVAEAAYRRLLEALGEKEASRPEVRKTPARAAKAWLELTSGCHVADPLSVVGDGIFDVEGARDVVVVRDMAFSSLCEHHLLPFWGTAHVAYIPNGRVLGLSKFARLLRVFSKRLQLQERLTSNIAEAIVELLAPHAVAVSVEARHACMSMRGIATPAVTRTVALRGAKESDPATRELLLSSVWGQAAPAARL